jgi:hypothetical protein
MTSLQRNPFSGHRIGVSPNTPSQVANSPTATKMQTDSAIIRARNAGPDRGAFPAIRDGPRSHDNVQYMVRRPGTMQAMSAQSIAAGGATPPQVELFQGTTTNVRMKGASANATWSPNARGPYRGHVTGVAPSAVPLACRRRACIRRPPESRNSQTPYGLGGSISSPFIGQVCAQDAHGHSSAMPVVAVRYGMSRALASTHPSRANKTPHPRRTSPPAHGASKVVLRTSTWVTADDAAPGRYL